ncbi:MAG: PQQ-dependent sugar dehydrogenase [Bacteroidetes bacterium]|nr:PQQ-dependent sugar dehydrogenase [Bacteroidota bacterium]
MKNRRSLFCAFVTFLCLTLSKKSYPQGEPFSTIQLVPSLTFSFPYEITYGPNDSLWVTERVGKRVVVVSPVNGGRRTVLNLAATVYQTGGQDGLMGLAIHPNFGKGTSEDFVYLAYTYDADPSAGVLRRTKITRYTYTLGTTCVLNPASATDLIAGLQGSVDHNSGRLKIGPDNKLYYTIGDQGNNQFGNMCNLIRALDLPTTAEVGAADYTKYQGKILRMNLDGTIPSDNPLIDPDGAGPQSAARSHIYSYGHRNPQGIVFAPDGKLYADEHGPKTDDEINLVQAGKNYGWPRIAGYQDDMAYIYGEWASSSVSCGTLTYSDYVIPASVPQYSESAYTHPDFTPPLKTIYTVPNGYNFQDPACTGNYFICWPTTGPSSLDIYTKGAGGIPGWANSLLVTSLKRGSVLRYKLSADGFTIPGSEIEYWNTNNRFRDIAISPAGNEFYVITDNSGATSGPSSGFTTVLDNPGTILKFTYQGILLSLQDNSIWPQRVTDIVRIGPNPTDGLLTIHTKREYRKPITAQLYNLAGVLLREQKSTRDDFSMDISAYAAGVYILKILTAYDQEVQVEKIIRR